MFLRSYSSLFSLGFLLLMAVSSSYWNCWGDSITKGREPIIRFSAEDLTLLSCYIFNLAFDLQFEFLRLLGSRGTGGGSLLGLMGNCYFLYVGDRMSGSGRSLFLFSIIVTLASGFGSFFSIDFLDVLSSLVDNFLLVLILTFGIFGFSPSDIF